MKTQKTRLEDIEKRETPDKTFFVIFQVLDAKSLSGEDLFKYKNKETGEEELMTLAEAQERFKDGTLIYQTYAEKWRETDSLGSLEEDA